MYVKTKGCKKCEESKKAFILLDKIGFRNVSIMCNFCETIWKLEDEPLPNNWLKPTSHNPNIMFNFNSCLQAGRN